jgi:hypothetical protein
MVGVNMAGLLGQGFDDPQSSAIMALAGGLLQGNFGGGLLGANSAYQGAQEGLLKRQLGQAQIDNYKSEVDARKAQLAKQQQMQEMLGRLFGGGAPGAGAAPAAPAQMGQLGSGSFGVVPPPAGAPAIPPTAPARSGLAGASIDQIAALHALGGPDLLNAYKAANEGFERKPGSFYDMPGGRREYIADPTKGIDFRGGRVSPLPGAPETQGALAYATKSAEARAAAENDAVQVYNPATQRMEFVPRSRVLAGAGGAPAAPSGAPAVRPMPAQAATAQPGMTGNFSGDPAPVMEAILQIKDPQERANAMSAFTEQAKRTQGFAQGASFPPAGNFAAGPSFAESAAKEKAVKTAEADVVRDTTNRADSKRYGQMSASIDRAMELLQAGPTESGFGRAVDATAGFFGGSPKGAALAAQLKTLGGWLTANVPRMEGPQSDRDVINYGVMAGAVGDDSLPVAQRMAAAQEVKRLQQKYAQLNGYSNQSPSGAQPARQLLNDLPSAAPKGTRVRDTQTGEIKMFNGLSWVREK